MTRLVNSILDPTTTYFDPLLHTHKDLDLDLGLERLHSLESIGIVDSSLSSVDEVKISQFQRSIEFIDGKYHVDLPWYEDVLERVPSNFRVALATLNRVVQGLEEKDLLQSYIDVFKQKLEEGNLEEIDVSPEDYHHYIFIPHRPVIKEDLRVTTQIRPVLNCSLKVGGAPSLNQA